MLSTGYNCRDLLNIGLMRPIFSPTEYIQIKGRGTRLFTFKIGNTEYEKKHFFLLDFCAVAEYFEEKYDYTVPLQVAAREERAETEPVSTRRRRPGKSSTKPEAGRRTAGTTATATGNPDLGGRRTSWSARKSASSGQTAKRWT